MHILVGYESSICAIKVPAYRRIGQLYLPRRTKAVAKEQIACDLGALGR
jgi:hypothetical protein